MTNIDITKNYGKIANRIEMLQVVLKQMEKLKEKEYYEKLIGGRMNDYQKEYIITMFFFIILSLRIIFKLTIERMLYL